jgi:hypothetical protein
LAKAQGVLHGHQLPALDSSRPNNDPKQFFATILAGATKRLEPIQPNPIVDDRLNEAQREAVARALATPDICLIQGLPVTGKSRVAAEIVARAVARGERVLLASPHPGSVDHTLQLVQSVETICAVRCLGRDERAETLPEWSRALLFAERVRLLQEEAIAATAQQCNEWTQRHAALSQDAALWPHLLELAERYEELTEQGSALARGRDAVPEAVDAAVARVLVSLDRSDGSLPDSGTDRLLEAPLRNASRSLAQSQSRIDTALSAVNQQIDQERSRLSVRVAQQDVLAAFAEAKAGRRWWTSAWWRAMFQGDVTAKLTELEAQVREARDNLTALETEASRLSGERRQADEQARLDRLRLVDSEVARRYGELEDREAAQRHELTLLEKKWADAITQLSAESTRPSAKTVQSVRESRTQWQRATENAAVRRTFAADWAAVVRHQAPELAEKLRQCVNLVAAIAEDLPGDQEFGDSSAQGRVPFDLLVLEHAEQVPEAQLLGLAARCRRWVLLAESDTIGRVRDLSQSRPYSDRSVARSKLQSRRNHPNDSCVFQRLWEVLHCDPGRLSYVWLRETDARLCCRLRPVSPQQRRWIETERVADHPEIELRIVAPPRGIAASAADSFLAEVVFPKHMPLVDAKAYIFRELQEVPVRASARSLQWSQQPDRFLLHLTDDTHGADLVSWVSLAPGLREIVAMRADSRGTPDDGWVTRALEFDRSAGWEKQQVEDWTRRVLGLTDTGRTALLVEPVGMSEGLATVLSDILFDGGYRLNGASGSGPALEFVAVPGLSVAQKRSEPRKPRMPSGAGFEMDPADPQSLDRLRPDHRAVLGGCEGLANYPEAQAVVRYLSRLVTQLHAQDDGCKGRPGNGAHPGPHASSPHSVAVIALYPAQARLIRHLLERTPEILASARLKVWVDVPSSLPEREFSQVLVSFTRSHTHRATSFGEGPAALICALTRGRDKLVLFGDLGTLARRAEWQGALDHLTDSASARERTIISRLLGYVEGHGRHAPMFQMKPGAPPIVIGNRGTPNKGQTAREGSNA